MGDCQNYGPFLVPYFITGPYVGDPKRDHNFDNPPYCLIHTHSGLLYCVSRWQLLLLGFRAKGLGIRK